MRNIVPTKNPFPKSKKTILQECVVFSEEASHGLVNDKD
jgi:hypothetical protein